MNGSCHCGAVTLAIPEAPTILADCNCSVCRRYGVLWTYWPREAVSIAGPTVAYVWGRRGIAFHHCPTCGGMTHWAGLRPEIRKVGVNARMLDGFPFPAAEVELLDGASAED